MNLVIDIGNTLCKVAIFQDDRLMEFWTGADVDKEAVDALVKEYRPVAGIVSTVRKVSDKGLPAELGFLSSYGFPVIMAGVHLRLPLAMRYRTPETLGTDRLASAVAAWHFYPNENTLVIGAGTCLTTDFVTGKGEYLGGTIAPGLRMRLQALHESTGNLPLVDEGFSGVDASQNNQTAHDKTPLFAQATQENPEGPLPGRTASGAKAPQNNQASRDNPPLPGQTTREAILAGVIHGMAAEMGGLIDHYRKKISFFNVILTGGDRKIFDKKLKNRIFAVENIVLHGLNQLLKHNV